jgi:hypothetical protein
MNKKILTLFAGAAIFILAGCVPGDFEWIQATATAAAESGVDTAEPLPADTLAPDPDGQIPDNPGELQAEQFPLIYPVVRHHVPVSESPEVEAHSTAEPTSTHNQHPHPTVTRPTDSPVPAATKTADTEPYPSPFTPTPMTPG